MPAAQGGNAVVLERIESLRCDIAELKDYAVEQRSFRVEYERRHAEVEKDIKKIELVVGTHEREIETLKKAVEEMEKSVKPLVIQSKIIAWIGSAIGLSVLALIWAIITQQVTLVFP